MVESTPLFAAALHLPLVIRRARVSNEASFVGQRPLFLPTRLEISLTDTPRPAGRDRRTRPRPPKSIASAGSQPS